MYDCLLSKENKKFREEVRTFVKNAVHPSLLKKMDKMGRKNAFKSEYINENDFRWSIKSST